MTLAERFWAKVDRRGPAECWPWIGGKSSRRYGYIKADGRQVGAHRVSLEIAIERRLAPGEWACHTCDFSLCVNPAHLYVGDAFTNNGDTLARGRSPFTEDRRRRVGEALRLSYAEGRHAKTPLKERCKPHQRRCRTCTLDGIHRRRAA